jgi:hypothetical protein
MNVLIQILNYLWDYDLNNKLYFTKNYYIINKILFIDYENEIIVVEISTLNIQKIKYIRLDLIYFLQHLD